MLLMWALRERTHHRGDKDKMLHSSSLGSINLSFSTKPIHLLRLTTCDTSHKIP